MNDALLSPMSWLVAGQFMLYATGWALCGVAMREQRVAALHWAGFMAFIGVGFMLNALRGEPRTWIAYTCSGWFFEAGLLLLWRGLSAHFGIAQRVREQLLVISGFTVAMVLLGPGLDNASWRVLMTNAANLYVLARTVGSVRGAVRDQLGRRVALLAILPGLVMIGALLTSAVYQLADMKHPVELQRFDAANVRSMYFYIVAAAIFNFTFVALVTTRLLRQLRDLSERDALTGLYNRRALELVLQREWRRWRRGGAPFSLLVFDLDHFKRVNDTYGHPVGDEVLVKTARYLAAQARDTDTVVRMGGEEFLVLMPQTDGAGALLAAERLRKAICGAVIDTGAGPLMVTASIGVAEVAGADADASRLLQRADQALYRAKGDGRNRALLAPI